MQFEVKTVEVGPDGVHQSGALPEAWLQQAVKGGQPVYATLGDGSASYDLQENGEDDYLFRGHVQARFRTECSRCLTDTPVVIDEHFAVLIEPGKDDDGSAEIELEAASADDVDLYHYSGGVIETGEILREQLVLALPFAPRCKDDCKGLCSQCGVDLNEVASGKETCNCGSTAVDPRLAALKDIKLS